MAIVENKLERAMVGTIYENKTKEELFDDVSEMYEMLNDMTSSLTGCYGSLEEMIEIEFEEVHFHAAKIIDRLKMYTMSDLTPDESAIYLELYEEQGSILDFCADVFENNAQYNVVKAILGAYIFGVEE